MEIQVLAWYRHKNVFLQVKGISDGNTTRAMQSVAYPLAEKLDLVTLTFDLENQ
jgi:hypothetical protein